MGPDLGSIEINYKNMDRPTAKRTTRHPDEATAQAPRQFFPDIATVHFALEAGRIGVWSWDIATDVVTWSNNIESIVGLAPETFGGTFASFANDIHDEDRARVLEAINAAVRTGDPYEIRFRVAPRPGRTETWIEAAGTVIKKAGAPARMVGLCHEVTEQVKLQEELRSRAKQQEPWRNSVSARCWKPISSDCSTTWSLPSQSLSRLISSR